MIKELGVNKSEERRVPAYLVGLLSIILIATFIFTLKSYEPAKNILITGGIMVYPLSFLVVALISKYYGFKESRRAIFISSFVYISFFLLIMFGGLPASNNATAAYSSIIQFFFTNESLTIGNFTLYYPALGQLFSVVIAYLVSHLLLATIYNAVSKFTVDYLAVGLSLFIAYIVDRLLYMPILLFSGIMNESNTFDYLIKCLTSEFMASIMITILIIIIYILFTTIKKAVDKK